MLGVAVQPMGANCNEYFSKDDCLIEKNGELKYELINVVRRFPYNKSKSKLKEYIILKVERIVVRLYNYLSTILRRKAR